jgi:hypothetical protein
MLATSKCCQQHSSSSSSAATSCLTPWRMRLTCRGNTVSRHQEALQATSQLATAAICHTAATGQPQAPPAQTEVHPHQHQPCVNTIGTVKKVQDISDRYLHAHHLPHSKHCWGRLPQPVPARFCFTHCLRLPYTLKPATKQRFRTWCLCKCPPSPRWTKQLLSQLCTRLQCRSCSQAVVCAAAWRYRASKQLAPPPPDCATPNTTPLGSVVGSATPTCPAAAAAAAGCMLD